MGRALALGAILSIAVALVGCGVMPTSGPAGDDIRAGQKDPRSLPYAVIKVTPQVEAVLATNAPRLGAAFKGSATAESNRVGDRRRRQRYHL